MARITLRNVALDFPIVNASSHSLQLRLFQTLGGQLTAHHSTVVVRALDNIDLELRDGDSLGIIGHNGSGKTSLLRVFAGVYTSNIGLARIEGSISSFTDISLGMDPESTGWENIIFRCAFMGMTFEQAKRVSPGIAEFSELGDYLDLPVRTYSTGMFLRLAFAISTSVEPDILIMDEMIATGDAKFIQKAKRRIQEVVDKANILTVASHDLKLVREICNKALWLEHGVIKQLGAPADVTAAYEKTYGATMPQ